MKQVTSHVICKPGKVLIRKYKGITKKSRKNAENHN